MLPPILSGAFVITNEHIANVPDSHNMLHPGYASRYHIVYDLRYIVKACINYKKLPGFRYSCIVFFHDVTSRLIDILVIFSINRQTTTQPFDKILHRSYASKCGLVCASLRKAGDNANRYEAIFQEAGGLKGGVITTLYNEQSG